MIKTGCVDAAEFKWIYYRIQTSAADTVIVKCVLDNMWRHVYSSPYKSMALVLWSAIGFAEVSF